MNKRSFVLMGHLVECEVEKDFYTGAFLVQKSGETLLIFQTGRPNDISLSIPGGKLDETELKNTFTVTQKLDCQGWNFYVIEKEEEYFLLGYSEPARILAFACWLPDTDESFVLPISMEDIPLQLIKVSEVLIVREGQIFSTWRK